MSYYNSNVSTQFYTRIKIKDPKDQPIDTVQVIANDPYRPNDHGFAAGGWDGILRYYQILTRNNEEIQLCYSRFLEHPIISLAIGKNNIVFAGLATGDILAVDMSSNQSAVIGAHSAAICKLFWIDSYNLLMSLGYDQKLKFWNMQNTGNFLAKEFDLPFKTHTAAFEYPYLMVGTANGKVGFMNTSTLPNLKIPDQNGWFDLIEVGSKFICSTIKVNGKFYAFGCADGRCSIGNFQDSYNGIRPLADSSKKMMSKSQKKQSSYSQSPLYGQVNDIDIGFEGNYQYLVIVGSEDIAFFNLNKKEKPKRIKTKGTAGKLSLDSKYFVFAEGNDWCEGINEWKKSLKAKIQAVKFTKSELDALVAK